MVELDEFLKKSLVHSYHGESVQDWGFGIDPEYLELQDQGNQIAMDLLKHPSRPPRRAIQETPGGYNQQTILPPRLLSVG